MTQYTRTKRLAGGYQVGDPQAVFDRYATPGVQQQRPMGMAGFPVTGTQVAPIQPSPVAPPVVATGYDAIGDSSTMAQMPAQNAMQRQQAAAQEPEPTNAQRTPWDEWQAQGGSRRTFNRANAARGIRPRIDGRAVSDPRRSTASEDIRQRWGWNTPRATTEIQNPNNPERINLRY